jgi:hypothetical protein
MQGPTYFNIVHHILKLLATGRAATPLRDAVARFTGEEMTPCSFAGSSREIENLSPADRHALLAGAAITMTNWPDHFIKICQTERLWSTAILRDMSDPPTAILEPVMEHLYRASYVPDGVEIDSAKRVIRRTHGKISVREVKRYVSTEAQVQKETGPLPPSRIRTRPK